MADTPSAPTPSASTPSATCDADASWPTLGWRIGVEVELLAPLGVSREDLALRLAAGAGGAVTRYFHPQTEPSLAPGVEVFDNLTLGFRVTDATGAWLASCVDDLTLQDDLDRGAPSKPGWFRVVSDDRRLLLLTAQLGRADGSLADALDPVAAAFGTEAAHFPGGLMRVCDQSGAPVVMGATLPGERERPCELVTAPLDADHGARLDTLLQSARALGFTVPREAATHVHFDATALHNGHAIRNLVRLWQTWGPTLKTLVGTNPACRQLGDWPDGLVPCVENAEFVGSPWPEVRESLEEVGLSKFCDLNLSHLALEHPAKDTIEVRVLPGMIDTDEILLCAALFEALLHHACAEATVERLPRRRFRLRQARALLQALPLAAEVRDYWLAVAEARG